MNKILSQALKKAVSEYSPKVNEVQNDKRPDLFSLNNETELFQNDKGIIIKIDRSKDVNLTDFGKATLKDRYLGHNESFQDLFARVASSYADDNLHAQRIYNYIVICGLCQQHQFYRMEELKEDCQFHVF